MSRTLFVSILLCFVLLLPSMGATETRPDFPTLQRVLEAIDTAGYAERPERIPSTVIDNGVLKFVPYVSYRIGVDREVNIYGDPESPACIEIGLYRSLLQSESEKRLCLALADLLMPDMDVTKLRTTGDRLLKRGVSVEITLPDAPDAYGGWWVSVYSMDRVNAARGTRSAVNEISQTKEEALKSNEWTPQALVHARSIGRSPIQTTPAATSSTRPPTSSGQRSHSVDFPRGGRVYVKSYYRKDGTYVRAHSRRR